MTELSSLTRNMSFCPGVTNYILVRFKRHPRRRGVKVASSPAFHQGNPAEFPVGRRVLSGGGGGGGGFCSRRTACGRHFESQLTGVSNPILLLYLRHAIRENSFQYGNACFRQRVISVPSKSRISIECGHMNVSVPCMEVSRVFFPARFVRQSCLRTRTTMSRVASCLIRGIELNCHPRRETIVTRFSRSVKVLLTNGLCEEAHSNQPSSSVVPSPGVAGQKNRNRNARLADFGSAGGSSKLRSRTRWCSRSDYSPPTSATLGSITVGAAPGFPRDLLFREFEHSKRVSYKVDSSSLTTCLITSTSGCRGGVVVRLLASHLGDLSRVTPRFSHVGIVPDDDAGRWRSPVSPALAFRRCSVLASLRPRRPSRPRCLGAPKSLHSTSTRKVFIGHAVFPSANCPNVTLRRYRMFKGDCVAARPRSRSEGAIRATLTRTPSASSLLHARRAVFPSKYVVGPRGGQGTPASFPADVDTVRTVSAALLVVGGRGWGGGGDGRGRPEPTIGARKCDLQLPVPPSGCQPAGSLAAKMLAILSPRSSPFHHLHHSNQSQHTASVFTRPRLSPPPRRGKGLNLVQFLNHPLSPFCLPSFQPPSPPGPLPNDASTNGKTKQTPHDCVSSSPHHYYSLSCRHTFPDGMTRGISPRVSRPTCYRLPPLPRRIAWRGICHIHGSLNSQHYRRLHIKAPVYAVSGGEGWLFSAFEAERRRSDKDDIATCIKCAITAKRKAQNWRAVFLVAMLVPTRFSAAILLFYWGKVCRKI
ncbi:hypothetical protein PR048_016784 [Dryococelus australis]|uniref:Uncharacterized protein n=1 Tax=Dryococelus australis TaxID=614101 RepID=A0ABQ9H7Q8_9NEOP|nr:hypothetical protein PR048_016784 [Dryococelus australis]